MTENGIHQDVVILDEGVFDHLEVEADSDLEGVFAGVGQHAVVVATTAAQTTAVGIEGELSKTTFSS